MLNTAFTDLVGCSVPIQQAGMGGVATPELAAAVAEAGALGMVNMTMVPADDVAVALDGLVKVTTGETSLDEFEKLTRDAEDILQRLGLHYQVMAMCTGDMGFAQYKKYDLMAWAPGLDRFLEVSSCSTFNDFQAMRANLRYRPGRGAPPKFAHTINGSGLALPRTIDAIIETYQRSDGMISVPEALKPYMGGVELIGAR